MSAPPRDPKEPIVPRALAFLIAWQGLLIASVTFAAFALGRARHGAVDGSRAATTIAFMTLSLAQLFHAFSARSRVRSIVGRGMFANPWLWIAVGVSLPLQLATVLLPPLRALLHTSVLDAWDWSSIVAAALTPVVVVELVKLASRRFAPEEDREPGSVGEAAADRW